MQLALTNLWLPLLVNLLTVGIAVAMVWLCNQYWPWQVRVTHEDDVPTSPTPANHTDSERRLAAWAEVDQTFNETAEACELESAAALLQGQLDPTRALRQMQEVLRLLSGTDLPPKANRYVQIARDTLAGMNSWGVHPDQKKPESEYPTAVAAESVPPVEGEIAESMPPAEEALNGAIPPATENQEAETAATDADAVAYPPLWQPPAQLRLCCQELRVAEDLSAANIQPAPALPVVEVTQSVSAQLTEIELLVAEVENNQTVAEPAVMAVEPAATPAGTAVQSDNHPARQLRNGDPGSAQQRQSLQRRRDDHAFNQADLLHRCLNDRDFMHRILQKFATRGPETVGELATALVNRNYAAAARQANLLRSMAANLTAENLRAIAGDLEYACGEGSWARAEILLYGVKAELQCCLEKIREWRETAANPPGPADAEARQQTFPFAVGVGDLEANSELLGI
ncbi:MAG: Hpt domain-containing protein [Pirellulales bacterium]|nr:Hpt domain-containing protein [Pirellulales bacterium]